MKIVLIDAFNLFIRCFSSNSELNANGEHVGGVSGSIASLYSFLKRIEPDCCILCYEGKNSGNRRRKSFHDYKSGRKSPHTIKAVDDIIPQNEFWRELLLFQDLISLLPLMVVSVDSLEADDVIAYLVSKYSAHEKVIVSTDKDYYQLIDDNTQIYNPTKKVFVDRALMLEKYKILPENWIFVKCFLGDRSDNVQKIQGFGMKRFSKFFPELSEVSLKNIDEFIELCKNKKEKKLDKYVNSQTIEILKNNYTIMNLRQYESFLNLRHTEKIETIVKNWKPNLDLTNLYLLMTKSSINLEITFSNLSFVFKRLNYESTAKLTQLI